MQNELQIEIRETVALAIHYQVPNNFLPLLYMLSIMFFVSIQETEYDWLISEKHVF